MLRIFSCLSFCLITLLLAAPAPARDRADSRDPPVIGGRFPDAAITAYDEKAFARYTLVTGRVPRPGASDSTIDLLGRVTTVTYRIPANHTTIEVARHYGKLLGELGFTTLYRCAAAACGGQFFNRALVPDTPGFTGNEAEQHYIAARLDQPEGAVFVAVYVVRDLTEGGPDPKPINVRLTVIETAQGQSPLFAVDAGEMETTIANQGAVPLYAIFFAADGSDILPGSETALEEVKRLLTDNPGLQLYVVGHTDNAAPLAHSLELSQRRAAAVVAALVERYGIDAARLEAHGVGPLAPLASNRTEDGRALNRRIELVER